MDPGWYDDPFHRFVQRYHDGTDWTSHVSDGSGTSSVDPSGAAPVMEAAPWDAPPPPVADDRLDRMPAEVAGPWIRLGARIIDSFVLGIPVGMLVGATIGPAIELFEDGSFEIDPTAVAVTVALGAIYEVVMIAMFGRTVGKMACGLTVVDQSATTIPSWSSSFLRWFGTMLYVVPLLGIVLILVSIGMIFTGAQRQMVHDKVARTVVVTTASLNRTRMEVR